MDKKLFEKRYREYCAATEQYLGGLFLDGEEGCAKLYEAMRYSLLSGGKRLRPVLTLEFARLCGCNPQTLRYYDRVELLKPVKVDEWSG